MWQTKKRVRTGREGVGSKRSSEGIKRGAGDARVVMFADGDLLDRKAGAHCERRVI